MIKTGKVDYHIKQIDDNRYNCDLSVPLSQHLLNMIVKRTNKKLKKQNQPEIKSEFIKENQWYYANNPVVIMFFDKIIRGFRKQLEHEIREDIKGFVIDNVSIPKFKPDFKNKTLILLFSFENKNA